MSHPHLEGQVHAGPPSHPGPGAGRREPGGERVGWPEDADGPPEAEEARGGVSSSSSSLSLCSFLSCPDPALPRGPHVRVVPEGGPEGVRVELLGDGVAAGEGRRVGQGVEAAAAAAAVRGPFSAFSFTFSSPSSSLREQLPRQRAPEGPLPQPLGITGVCGQVLERDLLEAGQRRLPVSPEQILPGGDCGGGRCAAAAAERHVCEDEAFRLQKMQHRGPGSEALPCPVALGDARAVFQDDVGDYSKP